RDIDYIPISAKLGDNVVDRSEHMPWYGGTPLLEHLETVQVADARNLDDVRFPVQWVIRDHATDYRGYAGQLAGGVLRTGDEVLVLPSRLRTRIAKIDTFDGDLPEAVAGMSVTLLLEDELDVSRGDIICRPDGAPQLSREFEATVCWMADAPLRAGARYAIKHATHGARAIVDEVVDHVDVHTLTPDEDASELGLNDIGRVRLRTSKPMAFDPYARNRATGSFILIDESTNDTVGAGMIL
ncbi:MAG TPA: sulfate adenylyltransferase, partial [Solirubrobacteraceae bacterium]